MGNPRVIRPGDNLLLRLPNGELKLVKIAEGDGRGSAYVPYNTAAALLILKQ